MPIVNLPDAKSNLSRLVDAAESGAEAEIIIARNGKPAAKLAAVGPPRQGRRLGAAKGKLKVPTTSTRIMPWSPGCSPAA